MPTIRGEEVTELIDLFNQRGVKFYHACQLKDFETYLQLGGIPSRLLMQTERLPYTAFETDEIDQQNRVWDMVFGNLSDFGYAFANGNWRENTAPIPTVYGPILLITSPDIFREANDVAICLRSAGGRAFNRERESRGIGEVERIFTHSIESAPTIYARAYIKYSNDLRKEFNDNNAMSPEISCIVDNQRLSLNYIERIIVDRYHIEGQPLREHVLRLAMGELIQPIWERRPYKDERIVIINEVISLIRNEVPSLNNLIENQLLSDYTRDWANRIRLSGNEYQYLRYARYLREGTLLHILERNE
jgi:hypothetical protein